MSRWRPEPVLVRVPDGDDPVALLRARLESLAPARGARVVFALPVSLVRLQMVPWNESLYRRADRLAFAQACLREVYGDLLRDWTACVDEPRHGRPSLACAMPRELRDNLVALAEERALKLVSIEPSFARVFNERARGRASESMWLAVCESPAMVLLLVVDGRIERVKVVAAPAAQAAAQAAREWFVLGRIGACPAVVVADAAAAGA